MAAEQDRSRETLLGGRPLLRRSMPPLVAFVGVVASALVGFSELGNIGVVEAAFWLIDPTSLELHFRAHEGPERLLKGFAVLVRVGLVLSSLWLGETVLTAAFGGRIGSELERMQEQRTIASLEGHVVICGYGIFGQTIASSLTERGRDVVAIEREPEQFERLRDAGYLGIQGDARREETLREAGIEGADALVAAIDDSNANIQIAITARQLAPEVRVVVRVGDEMYESLARRAGADEVVIPEVSSGEQLIDRL